MADDLNPYESPKTTDRSVDAHRRKRQWHSPVSIVLCLVGTAALNVLDGQGFRNSLIFLFCWVASLTIWSPDLWKSRRRVSGRLSFILILHMVAIAWISLGLRQSYEYQKSFNEKIRAAKAWHQAHRELHNAE